MIRIGSARIDENGKIAGGKAGDQTGKEVSTQGWYLHKKGWIILRAKNPEVRDKIAVAMEAACQNNHIGYDQSQRGTLYAAAQMIGFNLGAVTVDCETDCSELVRVCLAYAGIKVPSFSTATERATLEKTGKFEVIMSPKYTHSSDYLMRGDILVTAQKGHTVVVLDNGPKAGAVETKTHGTVRLDSVGPDVITMQKALVSKGYRIPTNGIADNLTIGALIDFQKRAFPDDPDEWDGICGPKTWAKLL